MVRKTVWMKISKVSILVKAKIVPSGLMAIATSLQPQTSYQHRDLTH